MNQVAHSGIIRGAVEIFVGISFRRALASAWGVTRKEESSGWVGVLDRSGWVEVVVDWRRANMTVKGDGSFKVADDGMGQAKMEALTHGRSLDETLMVDQIRCKQGGGDGYMDIGNMRDCRKRGGEGQGQMVDRF
jgi:hypothetical protein